MDAAPLPANVDELYPNGHLHKVGPPPGIPEEDCSTVEAVHWTYEGGIFDGHPAYTSYYRPSAEEINALIHGGIVELTMFTDQMVMHSIRALELSDDQPTDKEYGTEQPLGDMDPDHPQNKDFPKNKGSW